MGESIILNILVGIIISLPLGPVGILLIQRTIANGRGAGLASGLGAAISDGLYAGLAAFSLGPMSRLMEEYHAPLTYSISILLMGFGVHVFLSNPVMQVHKYKKRGSLKLLSAGISTFLVTFTNPMTFIFIVGVYTWLNLDYEYNTVWGSVVNAFALFSGALLWWGFLTLVVAKLKDKINVRGLLFINRVAGVLIFLLGIYMLISGLFIK